ncbi:hypothetical protein CkaCkLH20_00540 [Colletotrichum karsti]|uniref:NB-ARC domain-containing protein n=1 Tax=Colletotrichum karsti TaxID=1095194 RepID=A0A9P6IH67_9PEZI|nr:uncharacterized protein CkaCkLH20_00540 [Colletotrichum karsti]KAF9882504.1 hypothetical protein CkaCkLH20_00540 [Colletotrichum karsti]
MERFAIETAHEYESPTGNNQEDEQNRNMVLRDFLSDEDTFAQPATQNFVDFDKNDKINLSNAAADAVNRYFERQPETSKTKQHNLPIQNKNFAGRDQDLHSIDELLSSAARICLLTGVSGIGKTATAIQYAYRFGDEYSYVFWVEAEAPGLLADKYATIAEALDLSRDGGQDDNSIIFRVREHLMKLEKRWLLILDNATTWTDISPYITKALMLSKGSVLITTKENPFRAAPNWLRQSHVQLGPLSVDHGREFLLTSIHPRVRIEDLHEDEDYELAAKTISMLNGLPLAISMVVGYVKESGCSLGDFLEMWDEKESRSKKPGKTGNVLGSSVDNTVDSLWDIGIREVPSNSRKLLNIMSFLNADKIPKSLLVGDHEEDYLDFLNASEVLSYKRMINKLSSRRLISWKETPTGEIEYSIHRILQEKIMVDMDDYSIADAFRKTFRLLRKRFPRADHQQVPNPSNWGACQAYMPHIESFHQTFCREKDRIESLAGVKKLELVKLFYDAGFHIWSRRGTLYNGQTMLETAVSLLDSIQYDRDSKLRADINCMLGLLRLEMSCEERVEGGRHLLEARRIREVISRQRPDDHDTDVLYMNAISDYALCLLNDHKFDEAGEEMRKCFERYKTWGPESDNPFENSKFYGNYSIVLMFQGKMDEAIRSVKDCLDLTLKFSGKKAQWYRRLFLLACIYLQVGDRQQALDLHLETLQARVDIDGKYDANFILSLYAVGAMYYHLGNVEEATVWRPIEDPVQDYPLACCDSTSVLDEDLIECDHVRRKFKGSTLYAHHREGHKWYYLGEQRPEEALLIKMFDSDSGTKAQRETHILLCFFI